MNRRDTLKALLVAATSGGFASNLRAMDTAVLDKFGGWTGKKFKATGFFRLEKDERWWLVTPEGNAFLSFGINHIHPNFWRGEYNLAAWQKIFGIENIRDNAQFNPALRKWCLKACEDYGFNTISVHNDLGVMNTPSPAVPYMQPFRVISIAHWWKKIPDENFVDVFSPSFEAQCEKLATEIAAPKRNDPYLLGYSNAVYHDIRDFWARVLARAGESWHRALARLVMRSCRQRVRRSSNGYCRCNQCLNAAHASLTTK